MWGPWTSGGLGAIICVSVWLAGLSRGKLKTFYCSDQGCASRVKAIFCNNINLMKPNEPPFRNCTGRPEFNETCQYKGHVFVTALENDTCEIEDNKPMSISLCTGDDPPCDFKNATPPDTPATPATPPPSGGGDKISGNVAIGVSVSVAVILVVVVVVVVLCYVLRQNGIRPRFDCFQDCQAEGVISEDAEDIPMLPLQTSSSSRDAQNSPSSAPPPSSPLIPTETSPEQDEPPHQE